MNKTTKIIINAIGGLVGFAIIVFLIGCLPVFDCGYCVADSSCTLWFG